MVSQVLEQPRGLVTQVREGALSGPTLAVSQVLMQLVRRSGPTLAVSQVRVRTKDFKAVAHKVVFPKGFSDKVLVHKVVFLKGFSVLLLLLLLRLSVQEQELQQANLTVVFSAQALVLGKLEFREQLEVKLTEDFTVHMRVLGKLDFLEQVEVKLTEDFLAHMQILATAELLESQAIRPSRTAPYLAVDSTLGFHRQLSPHNPSLMWDLREAGEMEELVVMVHHGG